MSDKQQRNKRFVYQPLACIRQTGIQRQPDGTVTYTFVAQVSKDLAPVMITLMVTEEGEVSVHARFDEAMHASLVESTPVLENGKVDVARRRA